MKKSIVSILLVGVVTTAGVLSQKCLCCAMFNNQQTTPKANRQGGMANVQTTPSKESANQKRLKEELEKAAMETPKSDRMGSTNVTESELEITNFFDWVLANNY